MKLPPLENLRIFEAVARLRGFTAAAESLALSHSAVSRRVSELEARLGVQLLHRTSRQVALTPQGKILFDAAQEALRRIEEATADIVQPARQRPLLVSCERSLAMRWLIPRLSQFQDAHPDLPVYLSTGGGPIDLARENIDLAIRRADFALDPRLVCMPLFPEYIGPVSSAHASAKAAQTRLHTTGRPEAWKVWARKAKTGAPLRGKPRDQYFDHFFLSLQAAEAGLGTAIAPLFMVVDSVDAGTLAAPAGFVADGSRYVALLRNQTQPGTPEARFLEWVQSCADETLERTKGWR
ncbi:MAG TPA: LysR family transcriptional regulator [Noviherbaspirillum sp.]|nr:LysR family transcriptional regulator [Noviherbaspirillum sp.]